MSHITKRKFWLTFSNCYIEIKSIRIISTIVRKFNLIIYYSIHVSCNIAYHALRYWELIGILY